jgi:hypothetical protein
MKKASKKEARNNWTIFDALLKRKKENPQRPLGYFEKLFKKKCRYF